MTEARRPPHDAGRRRSLVTLLGVAAWPMLAPRAGAATSKDASASASTPGRALLAAAWTLRADEARAQLGLLAFDGDTARTTATVDLPGRAHGLVALPDGSLLAVARRPGDWLLRWHPTTGQQRWFWIEPDRAFTGHALPDAAGRRLYTAETDLDSGQGLIGVRDAQSLAKLAEWPTQGSDVHALSWDAEGRLIVANGGVASRPETGRRKLALDRMDASLVRLSPDDGRVLGRWRLADERLSIRHLAWSADAAGRPVLGIALQAEHETAAQRAAAPVLALFDGEQLRVAAPVEPDAEPAADLGGYGGDIAAVASGFLVSCPRSKAAQGSIGRWSADGRWLGTAAWPQVCALAGRPGQDAREASAAPAEVWCGGEAAGVLPGAADARIEAHRQVAVTGHFDLARLRLDNHWLRLR